MYFSKLLRWMNLFTTRLRNFQEMRQISAVLGSYISPHKVKWALRHTPLDAQWNSPQTTRVSLKTNGLYKSYFKKTDFSELQYRFRIWYSLISNSYNSRTGPLPRREKFYRPRTNSPRQQCCKGGLETRGQWRAAEGNVFVAAAHVNRPFGMMCNYTCVYISSSVCMLRNSVMRT